MTHQTVAGLGRRHLWQSFRGFSQQRCFIVVARREHEQRDHVAVAVAERDGLVAVKLLVDLTLAKAA